MTFRKKLILTAYRVTYIDLREPAPRALRTEDYIVDSDWIQAADLVSSNTAGLIQQRYEGRGFRVTDLRKLPGKRTAYVDLSEIWASAQGIE